MSVKLTDRYPHPEAVQQSGNASDPSIEYLAEPVDAVKVPPHLKGMRTLFEGFHHFRPEQAQAILQDAVEKRAAIGVFEASLKPHPVWGLVGLAMWLGLPLLFAFRGWKTRRLLEGETA